MAIHKFHPSGLDTTKCNVCKRVETEHTCEICDDVNVEVHIYMTMLMCDSCYEKEKVNQAELGNPINVQARLDNANSVSEINHLIIKAREIDNNVSVRTDLFNAETVAIQELKAAIDSNPEITNKPYFLAQELTNRFNAYKNVIFELNLAAVEASNKQVAIQRYLNDLANKLRAEEREKLKISDINYKPTAVKPIKPAGIKTAKNKFNKADLKQAAKDSGLPAYMIQMIAVSKNTDLKGAVAILKASIEAGKSTK